MKKEHLIITALLIIIPTAIRLSYNYQQKEARNKWLLNNTSPAIKTVKNQAEVAEDWIKKNSPTYKFDGSNLEYTSINQGMCEDCLILKFSFLSKYPGYGNNRAPQEPFATSHTMEIVVQNEYVISAKTDGVYDEFNMRSS